MKKDSNRLCYWCIESPCLKKRAEHEEKKKGITRNKGENYQDYRLKLDKATNNMCKKYNGVRARREPRAEVFLVDTYQANSVSDKEETEDESREILQANAFIAHNVTNSNLEEDEERSPSKLHCHESCANYKERCETPKECKHKRLKQEECPINKQKGNHSCGMEQTLSRKDYNLEHRWREDDQQLQNRDE